MTIAIFNYEAGCSTNGPFVNLDGNPVSILRNSTSNRALHIHVAVTDNGINLVDNGAEVRSSNTDCNANGETIVGAA